MDKHTVEPPVHDGKKSVEAPSHEAHHHASSAHTAEAKSPAWRKLFRGTGIYGFELLMATFGLTVAAIVVDYGVFAFFNYLMGVNAGESNAIIGEFSLWIVAAMLVWVPLALAFYFRTRGQLSANPAQRQATLHKVLVSIYLFVNTIIAAGALFALLYMLIRLLVGVDDAKPAELLVRAIVPALLVVAIHGWMLFAYTNIRKISRKVFGLTFAAIALAVMVALLVSSVGAIRGAAMDEKKEKDLRVVYNSINDYRSDKSALPESLKDLDIDDDDLKLSLTTYTYEKVDAGKYELCTKFANKNGSDTNILSDTTETNDGYSAFPTFTSHDKGTYCFKVRSYNFNFNFSGNSGR